mgnify:CR=1 FL=1
MRRTRPLYFTGESHAGHYIPNMIQHLLERNAQAQPGQLLVDVRGAAMGNPWVDPPSQVCAPCRAEEPSLSCGCAACSARPPFNPPSFSLSRQYDVSEFAHGLGLITKGQMFALKEANERCKALLKTGRLSQVRVWKWKCLYVCVFVFTRLCMCACPHTHPALPPAAPVLRLA